MVLRSNDIELKRTLDEVIANQTDFQDRIERLESLEFMKRLTGSGCLQFVDYDIEYPTYQASFYVEFNGSVALPSGNESHSQATIFWLLDSNVATDLVNLHMRWGVASGSPVSIASYSNAYKYTKGGALTQAGTDGQTSWLIGRIPGTSPSNPTEGMGEITVPFHSYRNRISAKGEWATHDLSVGAGSREEKGEWGGHYIGASAIATRNFTIFASSGSIRGRVYLYGWCPEMTNTGGPDD